MVLVLFCVVVLTSDTSGTSDLSSYSSISLDVVSTGGTNVVDDTGLSVVFSTLGVVLVSSMATEISLNTLSEEAVVDSVVLLVKSLGNKTGPD